MTELVATAYATLADFASDTDGVVLDRFAEESFLAELRTEGEAKVIQRNIAANQPTTGGVVAFDLVDGATTVRAFAALSQKRQRKTIAANAKDQRTTWEMPGHLAVLKKGCVTPTRYVGLWPTIETISFNWTHPDFDQSAWTTATSMSSVADAKSGQVNEWGTASPFGPWAWGADWLETNALTADIIGPSDGSVTDVSSPNAPNQEHYFRQVIFVASAGSYRMAAGADNRAEFFADSVLIGTATDWTSISWFDVDLTPGFHVISVHLTNYPATIANPCGYSWALYKDGGGFIEKSQAANTVHVEYQADPPGMSFGQAFLLALQPHIDAGRVWANLITPDFDAVNDSNGNAWDTSPNMTAQVGQDTLLDFVNKAQQSYADIVMDPSGWTLHAYRFGEYSPTSGVTLDGSTNIIELDHNTEDAPADELLVRSDGLGWSTVGSGETQTYFELGTEVAAGDVASISAQILAKLGVTRNEITASYRPASSSEVPWINADFVPGCTATAPDIDGSPVAEHVLSLGCSINESNEPLQVTITLKDRIEEQNERIITELKG